MARAPLTNRQQQVLDFIVAHTAETGYAPTVREIAKHLGIKSTNGVVDHLKAIERKGWITRNPMLPRTIRVASSTVRLTAGDYTLELSEDDLRLLERMLAAAREAEMEARPSVPVQPEPAPEPDPEPPPSEREQILADARVLIDEPRPRTLPVAQSIWAG